MFLRRSSKRFSPVDQLSIVRIASFLLSSAKNKKTKKEKSQISASGTHEQEQKWRTDEDKLVDLALKWDHFDGILPILQARQEEILKEKKNDFIQVSAAEQIEQIRH